MAETPKKVSPKAPYLIKPSGFFNTSHVFEREGEVLGTMRISRGGLGLISRSLYVPVTGERISLDRDPGLLRAQFGCWSEIHGGQGREWLGSSIRYSLIRREVTLHGGTKPFRLVPCKGFGLGWDLHAPKTGLVASFRKKGGKVEVTLQRKVDFYLLLLAYHNLASSWFSSIWPGPDPTPPIM
ncbi:MAG: hypothetical protein P1V81_02110 [Planctomycetota bacterium]|nr:hypothetical protein [Planctomycetota bacterium]